jgi:hypothetical protein
MAQRHRQPLPQVNDDNNIDKPLCVRYPGQPWVVFDDKNETIQHQKKGLELFIESAKENLDVSIPHALGGQFMAEFGKNVSTNEETGKSTIVYYYIKTNLDTVQMMYAEPAYIAFINRVVGQVD